MAGIGIKLNRIYSKNTMTTNIIGIGYSTIMTIAPMLVVILAIVIMMQIVGFTSLNYVERELFACTVLYIFIFSLLTASPFNAVLSKYLSDVIYEEKYADILPCFYMGLLMNSLVSSFVGIPFCLWEYLVGNVDLFYVATGYVGYMALVFVFYSMLYLSICKDYQKISIFYGLGMLISIALSFVFVRLFGMEIMLGMLLSLVIGFLVIASLEIALIRRYFRDNNQSYK
ncbi:MAG: polysaccharide biosynthesis protein PelG, partial [Clostridiales bacterium]|nr:polysaccharide biosynthesis protein PelG [Clostridiales bacterium]